MKIRFLLDENMSPDVIQAVKDYNKAIDILRIGDEGAPPLGTLDPEILLFCEAEHRMLVTENRRTIPGHLVEHYAAGHSHWGILELAEELPVGPLAHELFMFWDASEAEEWIDHYEWIPWSKER